MTGGPGIESWGTGLRDEVTELSSYLIACFVGLLEAVFGVLAWIELERDYSAGLSLASSR